MWWGVAFSTGEFCNVGGVFHVGRFSLWRLPSYHKSYCRHKPANQLLHCFGNIGPKGGNLLCSSVYLSVSLLSVFLTVCLSARPSVCPFVRPSVHQSCLSICFYCLSIHPSVSLSMHPSVCSFICPNVCLSIRPSMYLSICPGAWRGGNRGNRITGPGALGGPG